jgi:hypothetical protein
MKRPLLFVAVTLVVSVFLPTVGNLYGQTYTTGRPVKKLVEYGWDVPFPDQVRKEVRNMEKTPFNGVIFRLRDWNHAFDPRPWKESDLKPQLDDLAAIEWKAFTDNFLCLYAANNWKMDWYNDEQWKNITANLRLSAKAAKIGRCVGIVFDPEPYGDNPWAYPGNYKGRSYEDVEAQVFKRGAEFMSAIQAELPDVRLLTFYHQSMFAKVLDDPDLKSRKVGLSRCDWALLSAFWNGALEAAAPGVRIIDGHEDAYWFAAREPFFNAYHLMKQRSLALVPPELHAKRAVNFQAGMAIYMDYLFALRDPPTQYLAHYLAPEDRLRWLEQNVYYALTTSDEYVWCYGENMNWWRGKVPDGADAAIRSARRKIAEGKPLGYDIGEFIAAGQKKMAEAERAKQANAEEKKKEGGK